MMERTAPTTSRQAGTALGVLFVVSLFNYVDRSLLSILQVPIKADLGLSDAQLGALTGLSFAIFYATAALPIARLVDRWRRTWLMAAALAVWTTMTGLSGLATGFGMLVVLRIGVALGEAGSVPATHSLLADFFPFRWRGTVFAVWALASPIGIMLGVFAGGWLSEGLGWRMSFLVIGIAGWVMVPMLLLLREPPRGQFEPQAAGVAEAPPPVFEALRILWSLGSFRLLVAGTTLHAFAYTSLQNWLPPFYARVHGMPLAEVALWAALMIGLGAGAGSFLGGAVMDVLSRRDVRWYGWALSATMLLSAPLMLAQFFAPGPGLSIALGFVAMFMAAVYVGPVNAVAQSLVPPRMRGLTAAVLLLVPTVVGLGLGPLFTGVMSDIFASRFGMEEDSLRYALSLTLIATLVAAVFMLRMGNQLRHDLPQPAAAALLPA